MREPLVHRSLNAFNNQARGLVQQLVDGLITVDTPYQRQSVWDDAQRQGLVKSWLLGVPLPAIIVNRRDNSDWTRVNGHVSVSEPWTAVIDGKQRLLTARAWFEGEFAVPAWWFDDTAWYGAERSHFGDDPTTYLDLSPAGQRLFGNRALIPVAEAQLSSIAEEAEVYLLVNAAGTVQTTDDLDRAAAVARGER